MRAPQVPRTGRHSRPWVGLVPHTRTRHARRAGRVVSTPDVWQSAANVALVLSILGLGIVPAAWLILTTPTDGSDS